MRKTILIIVLGVTWGLLLFYYIAYSGEIQDPNSVAYLVSGMFGGLMGAMVYGITLALNRGIPWQRYPGGRLLGGIALKSWASILFVYGVLSWAQAFFPGLVFDFWQVMVKLSILVFVGVLLYSVIYFALYSYHYYNSLQVNEVKLTRRQIDLQLGALKAQLSPHFLFNSLNTISALIGKDAHKGERFIRKLALSYAYPLESYNRKWVSLEEELEFVQAYTYLLETRFEDQIEVDIQIPEERRQIQVPPLAVQMLVENAVKHNQLLPGTPLKIEIGINGRWLWVKNNKTAPPKGVKSHGIGLKNIQSRYKILLGKDIQIQDSDSFWVRLPIPS